MLEALSQEYETIGIKLGSGLERPLEQKRAYQL